MASERGPFATEFDRWAAGYLSGTTAQVNLVLPPMRAAWQARADIAEQREAELVALLEVAQCPQCNGSGIVQEGNGSIYECQWHHERKVLLAKHKAEGREGS